MTTKIGQHGPNPQIFRSETKQKQHTPSKQKTDFGIFKNPLQGDTTIGNKTIHRNSQGLITRIRTVKLTEHGVNETTTDAYGNILEKVDYNYK